MLLFIAVFVGLPAAVVCLGGAFMFSFGRWAPREKLLRVPIVLAFLVPVAFVALLFWASFAQMEFDRQLEFGPRCSQSELIGEWTSVRGDISLRADGTFVAADGTRRRWDPERGCGLTVGQERWQVFRQRGELKLLAPQDAEDDPDGWAYGAAYRKKVIDAGSAARP